MRYYLTFLICLLLSAVDGQIKIYHEPYRPQLHFSPPMHWMNDPNGLVYANHTYHLFYQYYPDSTVWGPMHWGHAVSKDLLHWQNLPIALYPDSLGYIFSGSAIADSFNTSGLKKGGQLPLIAMFTYHNPVKEKAGANDFQYQGIAFSIDGGYHWQKYHNNPVIPNPGARDFRDPKLSWHAPSHQWICTLAAGDEIRFYHSPDLVHWTFSSSFGKGMGSHGGVWECPDLISFRTNEGTKWVLIVNIGNGGPAGGSGTQYFVGNFNGTHFTSNEAATSIHWLDQGPDDYAGVTWSNVPDGRHIFLGWMSNWAYAQQVPTTPWRSAMTIPRILTLQKFGTDWRLCSNPVNELAALRSRTYQVKPKEVYAYQQGEIYLKFRVSSTGGKKVRLLLFNQQGDTASVQFDPATQLFTIDRTKAGYPRFSNDFFKVHTVKRVVDSAETNWHLLLDRSSLELFADDGSVVITELIFPQHPLDHWQLLPDAPCFQLESGKYFTFRSIWP